MLKTTGFIAQAACPALTAGMLDKSGMGVSDFSWSMRKKKCLLEVVQILGGLSETHWRSFPVQGLWQMLEIATQMSQDRRIAR